MQSEESSVPVTSFTLVAAALNNVIATVVGKLGGNVTRDNLMDALHQTRSSAA